MTRWAAERVALFGWFGAENLGNEASLAAGLSLIGRTHPEYTPVVVCAAPHVVSEQHGVDAVAISMAGAFDRLATAPRPLRLALRPLVEVARWGAAWRFARTVDAFVVPGTGVLDDFGVKPYQMPYQLFRWCAVAKMARRPWSFVGAGAGPIENPASRWLLRRTVRWARLVTYRDEASRAFMESIGEPSSLETLQPDLAFALTRPVDRRLPERAGMEVGLGLMAYYGWRDDRQAGAQTFERYVLEMTEIARRLIESGRIVRVLVGQTVDEVAVSAFAQGIERAVGPQWKRSVVIERIADFSDLLNQVAYTDAVIATRYHNVIAGLMMARPVVAVGYADKFSELMGSIGLGDFCHDVERVEASKVLDDLETLLARSDQVASELTEHNRRYSHAVEASFAAVLGGLLSVGRAVGDDHRPVPLAQCAHAPASEKDGQA
jgi:polysaccharide pyruvyl transferase WcaK-like protein